jgi:imidazolonepropionase-like amidohydrolase
MSANPATPLRASDRATFDRLASESMKRPIWLRVGQLIDGASDRPIPNADILCDAGRIVHVGTPADVELPAGRREPDAILPDHTLLPCLIEAHAHMFLDGAPVDFTQREQYLKNSPETLLARARARWPQILRTGIGAVRDAGDKHGVGLALAAESTRYRDRLSPTPYLDSPGAAIHHKGRYGAFMGEPIEAHPSPDACVAARVAQGADRIKLLVSGIINFKLGAVTTPPQMSIEEVRALVQAARARGRQTFAHASGAPGVEHSIEGGVNTVEHGFFITDEQLAKMRDRRIAWVPTFAPVQLQIDRAKDLGWDDTVVAHLHRIIEAHQKMLARAHQIGVTILAGSDAGSCGVPHGIGLLRELVHMQIAGMPPMAVLRSATASSAGTLNFPERIGRIAPDHRSRFILTRHDPLQTIANLQREKTIIFDGSAIHCDGHPLTAGL